MDILSTLAILACSTIVSAVDPAVINANIEARATTTLPESCTYRPTQTNTALEGCPTNCEWVGNGFWDAALVIPCGCTSGALAPTTITVCPTTTACMQFTTGWGLVVVTESPCPSATLTAY